MARDEQRWLSGGDVFPDVRRVIARVAAHVRHVDLDAQARIGLKASSRSRTLGPKSLACQISSHSAKYLKNRVVQKAVRVGHEANAHASGMIACADRSTGGVHDRDAAVRHDG
jgi:hypothetical protein